MTQTKETVNTLRPEITLSALDTTKVDKSNIIDGYCNGVSIPLIPTGAKKSVYEQVFCNLISKYVEQNGRDNTLQNQPINLDLIVDDNSGVRKYYIGALIEIQEDDPVYMSEEIFPTIQEKAAVELVLLKVTDPEEYLRKYTRVQVAQLHQIKDKLGFVMDEIDTAQDLYKSAWISPDYKTIAIGCIPNVHKDDSKIQFVKVGQ